MFCARLFICALWSPAGKGLTSWLSFVVSTVSLSLSHWYPGSGVVLNCIDSWSLHPYLLSIFLHSQAGWQNEFVKYEHKLRRATYLRDLELFLAYHNWINVSPTWARKYFLIMPYKIYRYRVLHKCSCFIVFIKWVVGKRDKMWGLSSILSLFHNEFDKFNNTEVTMLDFIYHLNLKLLWNRAFCKKTLRFCHIYTNGNT